MEPWLSRHIPLSKAKRRGIVPQKLRCGREPKPCPRLIGDMERGTKPAVLVTGGAGYIGAHTAKALHERGFTPVVFDNLSSGFREAIRWGPFVHGDIRNGAAVTEAIDTHA